MPIPVLLMTVALIGADGATHALAAPQVLPVAMHEFHPPRTLPNPTPLHVCLMFKHYCGGACTSPPYSPTGRSCTCEGPPGRAPAW